jgi:hypothetical protein
MLQQNRSETDDLHRTIAARDAELITERNVCYSSKSSWILYLKIFQHRLQIEEQLRQQLDNQKRLEDMHAIDRRLRESFSSKNKISTHLVQSNSDEKFNKLREEHLAVLHQVFI